MKIAKMSEMKGLIRRFGRGAKCVALVTLLFGGGVWADGESPKNEWVLDSGYIRRGGMSVKVQYNGADSDKGLYVGQPATGLVDGTLDLRGLTLVDSKGNAQPFSGICFGVNGYRFIDNTVTNLYCDNVQEVARQSGGTFGGESFKKIHLSGTRVTKVGAGVFYGCSGLKTLVLDFPNLRDIGNNAFYRCAALDQDIMQIVRPGVTNIGDNAFTGDGGFLTGLTGTLILTNIQSIGDAAFRGCSGLSGLDLRGPLGKFDRSFDKCTGLKTATLDLPALTNIHSGCFIGAAFEDVYFVGKPILGIIGNASGKLVANGTALGALLVGVLAEANASDPSRYCRLHVSKVQWPKWSQSDLVLTDFTDEEAANPPPEGCFGVFQGYKNDGYHYPLLRKAWWVKWTSPKDPSGFLIRIR